MAKASPNRRKDIGSFERELTPEYIRNRLRYEHSTGLFFWNHSEEMPVYWNKRFANERAGCKTHRYIKIVVNARPCLGHRLAWIYVHGEIPRHMRVDHINGDGADNRIENLRLATQSNNLINWTRTRENGLPRGIHWYGPTGKWVAKIQLRGRTRYFGYHDTVEEAVFAYQAGVIRLCGEFSPYESSTEG